MEENKNIDKKSLAFLKEKKTDWDELAKDCVSFANAQGGIIILGIDDKDLKAYPNSGFGDIHQRIGHEINQFKIKRMLKSMVNRMILETRGETRGMKYSLKQIM